MNYYDLTIWEEFRDKELNNLFNKTLRKNRMFVTPEKYQQIYEECKSYLTEEFFKISKKKESNTHGVEVPSNTCTEKRQGIAFLEQPNQ